MGKLCPHVGKKQGIELSIEGINALYQLFVRESEDRYLISISPLKLKGILFETQILSQRKHLSAVDFQLFFNKKNNSTVSYVSRRIKTFYRKQIFIATDGEIIGQLADYQSLNIHSTPVSFGEPSRISCIVHLVMGEVIDIERKSDLAGNIQAKAL